MSKKTFRLENGTEVTAGVNIYKAYASKRNKERYLKRKRNEYVAHSLDDERAYELKSDFVLEDEIDRRFEIERLKEAVKKLPMGERKLIMEYFFDDISLRTLAKKYGVSHTTIHSKLNDILEKLKEYIINNS